MTTTSAAAAALAASRTSVLDAPARATALIHAARLLLPALERGQPIDAAVHAVGASDSQARRAAQAQAGTTLLRRHLLAARRNSTAAASQAS